MGKVRNRNEKVRKPCHGRAFVPFEVIYQTRATVFHRDIQTPRRELKIDAQWSIFDEIRGV